MRRFTKFFFAAAAGLAVAAAVFLMESGVTKAGNEVGFSTNTGKTEIVMKDTSRPIGTPENPFTILEIVPELYMAKAGYLIPGCEPVDMSAIDSNSVFRQSYLGNVLGGSNNALNPTDPNYSSETVGHAYTDYSYAWNVPAGGQTTLSDDYECGKWLWVDNTASGGNHYVEVGYYTYVGENKGSYGYVSGTGTVEDPWVYNEKENGGYDWIPVGYYCKKNTEDIRKEDVVSYKETAYVFGSKYVYEQAQDGAYKYVSLVPDELIPVDPENLQFMAKSVYCRCKSFHVVHYDSLIQGVFEQSSFGEDGFKSQVIAWTADHDMDDNKDGKVDEKDYSFQVLQQADFILVQHQNDGAVLYNSYYGTSKSEYVDFKRAGGVDLSWDMVMGIMKKMASNHPAAILLQSDITGNSSATYNVEKLFMLLYQYDPALTYVKYLSDGNVGTKTVWLDGKNRVVGSYKGSSTWDKGTFSNQYGNSVMNMDNFGTAGWILNSSILCWNAQEQSLFKHLNKESVPKVERSEYESASYKPGNNVDMFAEYGNPNRKLTVCEGIVYLLKSALKPYDSEYKKELRILELQPCNQFIYGQQDWEFRYRALIPWFPWYREGSGLKLTVDTLAAYQFNGDIRDINSLYDLIIIGANQDSTNGLYGYNDKNNLMWNDKGKIYTAVGDTFLKPGVTTKANNGGSAPTGMSTARYQANDITRKKREELLSFVKSGKPVVVDSKLYDIDTDNGNVPYPSRSIMDQSSQMYKFLGATYKEDISYEWELALKLANTTIKNKMIYEDCQLILTDKPDDYDYTATSQGIISQEKYNTQTDSSGKPILQYRFVLNGRKDMQYTMALYLDRDGDGIYKGSIKEREEMKAFGEVEGADEEVSGYTIYEYSLDENGQAVRYKAENGKLEAGKEYEIVRQVPATERGILPWKLEVNQTGNTGIRCSVTGYTAIKPSSNDVVPINVLQMDPNANMQDINGCNVNFSWHTPLGYDSAVHDTEGKKYFGKYAMDSGTMFQTYTEKIEDFDIDIQFMMNSYWMLNFGEDKTHANSYWNTLTGTDAEKKQKCIKRWIEYLDNYDMLVLGFRDLATFTSNDIYYAGFMDFVNQGKSVILSHDIVRSDNIITTYGCLKYDTELRTLSGQRQKFYLEDTSKKIEIKNSGADYYFENFNYYMYSRAPTMSHEVNIVSTNDMKIRNKLGTEYTPPSAAKNGYSAAWVKTNIPTSVSGLNLNGLQPDPSGSGYYMDLASEFMDNSVLGCARAMEFDVKFNRYCEQFDTDKNGVMSYSELKNAWGEGNNRLMKQVKLVNDGQITNYPYKLNGALTVSQTHAQNYALDLEQCEGGDVTVWYNLYETRQGGLYSTKSMDSASDFYIYTKGNITYTGLGHSAAKLTTDEVKLFINTMISSYRPRVEKPYMEVINDNVTKDGTAYALYGVMVDTEAATITADLQLVDENLTMSKGRTYTLQFVDMEETPLASQPEIYTLDKDGNKKVLSLNSDGTYSVQRGVVYHMDISGTDLKNAGVLNYYMKVVATDKSSNSVVNKISTLDVYGMPLFDLN